MKEKVMVKHTGGCPFCNSEADIEQTENGMGEPVLSIACPNCNSLSTSRDGGIEWFTWLQGCEQA